MFLMFVKGRFQSTVVLVQKTITKSFKFAGQLTTMREFKVVPGLNAASCSIRKCKNMKRLRHSDTNLFQEQLGLNVDDKL